MTLHEFLIKLDQLFDKPERWTTEAMFRDAHNKPVDKEDAVKACLAGGIELVETGDEKVYLEAYRVLESVIKDDTERDGVGFITVANDCADFKTIKKWIRTAIDITKPTSLELGPGEVLELQER